MVTLFIQGQEDDRQMPDDIPPLPVSRFRPQYRPLTDAEKNLHDAIKAKAAEMEALFYQLNHGRYHALAMTALEEAVMWSVKELTS